MNAVERQPGESRRLGRIEIGICHKAPGKQYTEDKQADHACYDSCPRESAKMTQMRRIAILAATALLAGWMAGAPADEFRFAILGDRTGEPVAGVYEQVWSEMAAEHPAFVISVGDTIQGNNDATAAAEWREVERILDPYRKIPLYLAPGNHDIWSAASERLYLQHAAHPLHYGVDYGPAHFTILDNSRSDELPAGELAFLESDLKAHAAQPLRFIVMHRPSWLIAVALRNPDFALHQLARKYGVQYVIAGHIHEMLRLETRGGDIRVDAQLGRAPAGEWGVRTRVAVRARPGDGREQGRIHVRDSRSSSGQAAGDEQPC